MAVRMHLGMISDESWNRICTHLIKEYRHMSALESWLNLRYQAVEIKNPKLTRDADEYRVFEFPDEDQYMKFCLEWM